ncbi:MAG TPA: TRAP transporter small permease [Xanthobacteraceae bacterium]|nr:TRAP transporter small permease [Xanthobacteraceae bacterium]
MSDEVAATQDARRARTLPEGPVEWTCKVLSEAALLVMLVLIAVDIVTRSFFNFSFEVSDEVGGYMLVVICFLSLSACHVNGSFHQVEFVQVRLSPRARSFSQLIFGVLSLAACVLLAWQFIRFEMSSWRFGDVAPTYLATPQWLPRLPMAIGMLALCFSLCRTIIAEAKRLRRLSAAGGDVA